VRAARITPDPGGLSIEVDVELRSVQRRCAEGESTFDNALTVLAVLLAWNIPLRTLRRRCR